MSTQINLSKAASGVHVLTKPVSGRPYTVRIDSAIAGIAGLNSANTIYLSPFIPANTLTVSNLQINVTSPTVGGLARIVVYSDVAGVPTTKLLESTNLICSVIGPQQFNTTFTFTAGTTYWLGLYSNLGVTLSVINGSNLIPISAINFNTSISVLTASGTFAVGSAPNPLGTTSGLGGASMYVINLISI